MSKPPLFLLVEDDPDDVLLLRRALGRLPRRLVMNVSTDGRSAIDDLGRSRALPFLILTDVNLPLRSGWDVLAWCRGRPETQGVPVLVWTSLPNPEGSERASALGAARYIGKPRDLAGYMDVATLIHGYLGD